MRHQATLARSTEQLRLCLLFIRKLCLLIAFSHFEQAPSALRRTDSVRRHDARERLDALASGYFYLSAGRSLE